jgi:hypothetical protein
MLNGLRLCHAAATGLGLLCGIPSRESAIYFRPMSAGWPMTSTLNYALVAVIALGLFAVALAFMVW